MAPANQWAVAIHGGAGTISRDTAAAPYEAALTAAMNQAVKVLEIGHHNAPWSASGLPEPPLALAAALAAVELMEDCELFNAGRGGVLNDAGIVENEASVMNGATMRTGAVCGRTYTISHACGGAARDSHTFSAYGAEPSATGDSGVLWFTVPIFGVWERRNVRGSLC